MKVWLLERGEGCGSGDSNGDGGDDIGALEGES